MSILNTDSESASKQSSACKQKRFDEVAIKSRKMFKAIATPSASSGIPSCKKSTVKHVREPPGTGGAAIESIKTMRKHVISQMGVIGVPKFSAEQSDMAKNITLNPGVNTI